MGQFWAKCLQEFEEVFKDRSTLLILIILPLIGLLFCASLYAGERVTGLRLVVLDQDRSKLSRELIVQLSQSESFHYMGSVNDFDQINALMTREQAEVAVVIPEQFAQDVKEGKSPNVMTIIDGSNLLVSNTSYKGVSSVVQTFSTGVGMRVVESKGIIDEKSALQSVNVSPRIWYNPTFNYRSFLLLGLVMTILQQAILMGTVFRCKKKELLDVAAGALKSMLPTFFVLFVIGLWNCLLLLVTANYVLNITFEGGGVGLLVASTLFVLSMVLLSSMISTIIPDQLRATQVSVFVATPSFLISGYTWPFQGMPKVVVYLSQTLPLTHYLQAIKMLGIKGASISAAKEPLIGMTIIGSICLGLMVWKLASKAQVSQTIGQ